MLSNQVVLVLYAVSVAGIVQLATLPLTYPVLLTSNCCHLEIHSGAKCADDLMEHVLEEKSSHVVIGDFKPGQTYLITSLHQWKIEERQGTLGYPIQEVNTAIVFECVHTISKAMFSFSMYIQ